MLDSVNLKAGVGFGMVICNGKVRKWRWNAGNGFESK